MATRMKKAKVLPPLWDGAANMAEGVYTLTEAVENPIRDKRSSRDWNTPTFHKGQRFVIRPYDRLRVAYDEEEIKALPQAVQEKRYTMMLTFWPREYSGWLFANASSDDSDNYNARQTVLLLNALLPKLKLEPENLGTLIAFEEGFKGNLDSVVALLLDEGKVTLDELRKLNTRAYDLYDDDKEAERLAFERRHGI